MKPLLPRGMRYSHYDNGVRIVAISIVRWGFLSDCCKVNPIDRKILVCNHNGVYRYVKALVHR